MPWDSTIESNMTTAVQDALTSAQTSLTLISNQTNNDRYSASTSTDAQAMIEQAKVNVDTQLQSIKDKTNTISGTIDSLYENTQSIQYDIENKLTTGIDKKQKLSDTEMLNAIRMEQANVLKQKNMGNYHSSWLGLWRPLTDESRTGLFVLSIVLGLIGLLSIVYLLIDSFGKMLPVSVQETTSIFREKLNRVL